jgi:hypothetical protein
MGVRVLYRNAVMLVGKPVSVGSTSNYTQGVCCKLNMATWLEQWPKKEVHAVIHCVHARHVPAAEICQLVEVKGEQVMSYQSVAKWCSDFKSSHAGTMGNEGSGRPTTTFAALQVDDLGMSAIQPRSGTKWFSLLSPSQWSSFWPQIC